MIELLRLKAPINGRQQLPTLYHVRECRYPAPKKRKGIASILLAAAKREYAGVRERILVVPASRFVKTTGQVCQPGGQEMKPACEICQDPAGRLTFIDITLHVKRLFISASR